MIGRMRAIDCADDFKSYYGVVLVGMTTGDHTELPDERSE